MYIINHNKTQQSANHAHIYGDMLYTVNVHINAS